MTAHERALQRAEEQGPYTEPNRVGKTVGSQVYHAVRSGWGAAVPGRPGKVAILSECGQRLDGRTVVALDFGDIMAAPICHECASILSRSGR